MVAVLLDYILEWECLQWCSNLNSVLNWFERTWRIYPTALVGVHCIVFTDECIFSGLIGG